jgi:uncharacterized protein
MLLKYFKGSMIFTVICAIAAFFIGYASGGVAMGLNYVFIALMLGILETSLSFDNAVVNAKVLEGMNAFWRKMFLTIGMIIAVFGMRVIFPLIIVWAVGSYGILDTLKLTWQNPSEFQKILVDQHIVVAGFGGSFLLMVFAKFFFDQEKDVHWIAAIEKPMSVLGKMEAVWAAFSLALVYGTSKLIAGSTDAHIAMQSGAFFTAGVMGILVYILVDGISGLLESKEEDIVHSPGPNAVQKGIATAGFGAFMYLEVLDASFSFDGVIGAFAITNNLFIIALGLGIGAFFVRSLTIMLVDKGTLSEYRFLEHGAFWAIGALAAIMFLSATGMHIPEVVSGLIGVVSIGASFLHSVRYNKKNP